MQAGAIFARVHYKNMQSLSYKKDAETAFVLITCESGAEHAVIEDLGQIDGIKEIAGTFGSYDIVATFEVDSVESLREVISMKVRKIEKIRTTTTLVCRDF